MDWKFYKGTLFEIFAFYFQADVANWQQSTPKFICRMVMGWEHLTITHIQPLPCGCVADLWGTLSSYV